MSDQPNEEWAGAIGDRWLAYLDSFEGTIAPVGRALLDHAGFRTGEQVVDVGCGGGGDSLKIARAVTPGGHVTGVDVAPQLIAKAEARRDAEGVANLTFVTGDAQDATPPGAPFDRLFSRFGVMFFDDTDLAFAHMRGWLKPGGRLDFACWAPIERNPWVGLITEIVARHVELPARLPDAPGPFRLADADATRAMLERVGFEGISIASWQGEQPIGGEGATPAQAARFLLEAQSIAAPLREAGGDLGEVSAELAAALQPYDRDGAVRMQGSAWFVTAHNPG
ncbi:MAG: class I SAM-dependent methyltransferase [Allosphingosinicella sp.]